MKPSSLFRIIFLVIVAVFVLNFMVLLVYFPIISSSSSSHGVPSLPLRIIKNSEPFGKLREKNLRRKHRQQRQRPPILKDYVERQQQQHQGQQGQIGRKQKTKATTAAFAKSNDTNTTTHCPMYGCPVYPPELTTPDTNQTIRKALESSGYSLLPSSSKAEEEQPISESRFGFASHSFATLSQKGKSHEVNQDRAVFVSPFLPDLLSSTSTSTKSFLACIFDGHGQLGHKVAQEVVEKFPLVLSEKLTLALSVDANNVIHDNNRSNNDSHDQSSSSNTNETMLVRIEDYDSTDLAIRKALNETFLEVSEKGTPSTFLLGGCTASVTLRWGSKLYVANAGDSETIVVSASASSKQQYPKQQQQQQRNSLLANVEYETRRDKANQPEERTRIEKLGGKIHVDANGFDPRVIVYSEAAKDTIGLAMSRCIGDWEWKAVGVTAEPTIDLIDLSKATLSDSGKMLFLLAASDGFWDRRQKHFYASQMAASFQNSIESLQNPRDKDDANAQFRPLYHLYDIIQRITPKVQKGYRDDITAMIVNLE